MLKLPLIKDIRLYGYPSPSTKEFQCMKVKLLSHLNLWGSKLGRKILMADFRLCVTCSIVIPLQEVGRAWNYNKCSAKNSHTGLISYYSLEVIRD